MAMAGFPLRRKKASVCRRVGLSHLHDAPESEGSERKEGLRQGSKEPGQEHFLAPSLSKGQVVVLDGLGAHRPKRIRELIEERGADLLFLPSYSPDLNPIEEAFSKVKALVRKEGARVHEALVEAIGRALGAVTPEDAASFFAHAGYWPQDQPL